MVNANPTSEICGSPPARGEKRADAPVGAGGCRVGSKDRELKHKRTRPNGIGTDVLDATSHDGSLRTSDQGGPRTAAVAHTKDAASNAEQSDLRPSSSLAESALGLLEGSTTVDEARLNYGIVLRSRRVARDGRHQEHASVLPGERQQSSSVRRTRASSEPRQGRRPQCGKAVCGSASTWAVGFCAWCQRNHAQSDRRCAACHRPATHFRHITQENLLPATQWWKESRETRLPAPISSAYKPTSDCLCFRDDCFYHLFRAFASVKSRIRCDICGQPERKRVGAPSHWRKVGAACDDMTQFFTVGAGIRRATLLVSTLNRTLNTNSVLCNACYCSYYTDSRRRKVEEQRHIPAVSEASLTVKDRLVCRITERVQVALGEGALVRRAEVEAWILEYRKGENLPDVHANYLRTVAQDIMTAISERDNDVTLVTVRGCESPEFDGRQSLKYLIPRSFPAEKIAKLDLMARTRAETICHIERRLTALRKRFQEEQRLAGLQASVDTTSVPPQHSQDAVQEAELVVREDPASSTDCENVR